MCGDAKQILTTFLKSRDRLIRLSTAVTYCELGWDWPLETTYDQLRQQITKDVSELLEGDIHHRRACMYIPSLCKRSDLKAGLITKENLQMLVKFCDRNRIAGDEEGTSVAFHSAQALLLLTKRASKFFSLIFPVLIVPPLVDGELAQKLIDIDAVNDITDALRSNCK